MSILTAPKLPTTKLPAGLTAPAKELLYTAVGFNVLAYEQIAKRLESRRPELVAQIDLARAAALRSQSRFLAQMDEAGDKIVEAMRPVSEPVIAAAAPVARIVEDATAPMMKLVDQAVSFAKPAAPVTVATTPTVIPTVTSPKARARKAPAAKSSAKVVARKAPARKARSTKAPARNARSTSAA